MAVKKIQDLQESLMNDKKGDIFFAPFSKFNPEPLRFANQLGKYVDEHNIQVVVVDYLQRCKSFTPLKWDSREYINQVMSAFSSAALGNFGSAPFVAVMLSQLTRAAEEKWLKTKGVGMTIYDSVEAPSIERDSFIVIGIYADPELRSNQNMVYKLLKNRDLAADVGTVQTSALPQYCYIGDMHSGQSVPTFSQEDAKVLLDIGF
jgi:replicative DNA helicase